jgi:hypothetical protein
MGALCRSVFLAVCAALLVAVSALPAAAREADDEPAPHGMTTLQLYGSWAPEMGGFSGYSGSSWGFGAAVHWSVATRWLVGIDAARFESDRTIVAPFVVGAVYGGGEEKGLRPYAEAGAGYYRLTSLAEGIMALGATGNARDRFVGEGARTYSHDAVGAYFGAGLSIGLSQRLGLDAGGRFHNWVDVDLSHRKWDGMISLRSGLSYRL